MLKQQAYSKVCFNYLGLVDTHRTDTEMDLNIRYQTILGKHEARHAAVLFMWKWK